MRFHGIIIALTAGIMYAAPAHADHQPALVVPGGSGPIIIDGQDAAGAVVEGDWGLYRPGHAAPTVFYPYVPDVDHWRMRHYYPVTGKRPRYGRYEIIPPANRRLPPPAESFHRYWSNDAPPVPAQIENAPIPPLPPIILAPRVRSRN